MGAGPEGSRPARPVRDGRRPHAVGLPAGLDHPGRHRSLDRRPSVDGRRVAADRAAVRTAVPRDLRRRRRRRVHGAGRTATRRAARTGPDASGGAGADRPARQSPRRIRRDRRRAAADPARRRDRRLVGLRPHRDRRRRRPGPCTASSHRRVGGPLRPGSAAAAPFPPHPVDARHREPGWRRVPAVDHQPPHRPRRVVDARRHLRTAAAVPGRR